MSQILSGVRVLDLSRMLAGPFCSQILADFGAEVIKVEDLNGDTGRWSPPMVGGQSAIFYTVNRNKNSIALDLKSEAGAEVFNRLVAISDIVIDQFRPGVMQRLGFGYDKLSEINPRIICCSLSGYGMTGPMSELAGHDINFLSMAGVIDMTGGSDGRPCIPGVQIAGMAGGGMYAVIAILLALIDRGKTGRGQFCDIAMLDGSISLMGYALGDLFGAQRPGNRGREVLTGGFACYNLYRCQDDKYFSLG
ncbi:MAG: CoA transferase, partial [Syntrophomonadaceae bacterium]|nr:CoA transferase [Syntrophomonadaceae bacterium]